MIDNEETDALSLDEWEVIFVLPNLEAPEIRWVRPPKSDSGDLLEEGITLGSARIAIASQEDARVKAAVAQNPIAAKLLEGFHDELGQPAFPPVLIASKSPGLVESLQTITAFRNAVALSVVLRNRAAWIANGNGQTPNWTDHFDFHPAQVGRTGVMVTSPALRKFGWSDAKFFAMPSPYVSDSVEHLRNDSFLYRALGAEWRAMFELPSGEDQFRRALFRSLEVAYMAGATPTKNGASEQEWGIFVALWVSAIETLAWVKEESADLSTVLDLLAEHDWGEMNAWLAVPFVCRKVKGVQRELSRVQHTYVLLYGARNSFLHGDKIHSQVLRPFGLDNDAPSLPAMAAVLYRTALAAYLKKNHQPESMLDFICEQEFADAFERCYGSLDE